MELPTYTSIWRIEKRLYKLYDFRLPMPLPVGQIIVFTAITLPYVILLTLFGLPFTHSLFWLYVLPPGVLTWLATRPVLESKRLPELVISQVRYLGEPPTWCRMAPLAEKDEIAVSGRVWRRSQQPATEPAIEPVAVPATTPAAVPATASAAVAASAAAAAPAPAAVIAPAPAPAIARPGEPPGRRRSAASGPATGLAQIPARAVSGRPVRAAPAVPARPAVPGAGHAIGVPPAVPRPGGAPSTAAAGVPPAVPSPEGAPSTAAAGVAPVRAPGGAPAPASGGAPAGPVRAPATPPPVRPAPVPGSARPPGTPPVVVVPAQPSPAGPGGPGGPPTVRPRTVERALSGPADQRSTNWRDRVVLVPGGLGPGRDDHDKRDRARAVLPVGGSRLVAVLGCTVGAGQSVTTLILADLLASLRGEAVAALDLNPGPASLAGLAAPRPALTVSSLLAGPGGPGAPGRPGSTAPPPGRSQLDVIAPAARGDGALDMGDLEYRRIFSAAAARYRLTFADPGASAVARVLNAADQLVLVAPASPDAARALAMTQEWLGAHGYHALTANSITVVNGLSKRSMPHAEQAELVVRGRCRAIVRVPWDDHLAGPKAERGVRNSLSPGATASRLGQLRPPVLQAYTALAGVLVAALAASPQRRRPPR